MSTSSPPEGSSLLGALARAHWMLAGHFLAGFTALAILKTTSPSWRDLLFWVAVASIVLVRWIDVTRLGGLTADGDPATRADARRFALWVTLGGVVIWTAVHAGRGALAS